MGTASWLATFLDQAMLEGSGLTIEPRLTREKDLAVLEDESDVKNKLKGRRLLRYLLPYQVGWFKSRPGISRALWRNERQYVTPTPYSPEETISWLFLPSPRQPRTYVLVLDPIKIVRAGKKIRGPRWVRLGKGIEFILPDGFPEDAVVGGWEMQVT